MLYTVHYLNICNKLKHTSLFDINYKIWNKFRSFLYKNDRVYTARINRTVSRLLKFKLEF